jgi:prepilin-type N-terminal cleavage/methylation domain-containing protein
MQKENGFTLMEMMVASAIFLIVVTMGIVSLLSMVHAQKVTQYKKQQFDILNSTMEEMVRHMRVGYHIRCDVKDRIFDSEEPMDCVYDGSGDFQASLYVSFEDAYGEQGNDKDQFVYRIEDLYGDHSYALYKSTDSGASYIRLTPEPIKIDPEKSGFTVINSTDPEDGLQPFVTIRLGGEIYYRDEKIPFIIQTAVTPRVLEFK